LADERSLYRGEVYAREGRVEQIEGTVGDCRAVVRGSRPYAVTMSARGRTLKFSCDCPVGADGTFCKHCVAVALVVGGTSDVDMTAMHPDHRDDPVRTFLDGLDRAALMDLVAEQARRDDTFRERLAARATSSGGAALDMRTWRQRLRKAFGSGRYIDYREAPSWAAEVDDALTLLDDLLDAGHANAVVELVEYAHGGAERAIQYVDDSDGWITCISVRLADLHRRACGRAALDPALLARRLVDLELGAELDTFHRAAATYAPLLGSAGVDEYRRLVQPRFDAFAADDDRSHERFRVKHARIGVAIAAGDPDELIAVKAHDLRLPDDYAEIAGQLADVGRTEEAIAWCDRGLSEHENRQHQLRPLHELLARLHRDRGEHAAAIEVFRSAFEGLPSLEAYRRLIQEAGESDDRDRLRTQATDHLHRSLEHAPNDISTHNVASTIIEIALYEGEADKAWRVATERGCHQRLWMQLARAREREDPLDAIPVYEREIDALIDRKNDGGYRSAVKLMTHIESLQARLDRPDAFVAYIEQVRGTHGRKTNLMRKMAAKGW
jgi:uncharacterized Zn finger protein